MSAKPESRESTQSTMIRTLTESLTIPPLPTESRHCKNTHSRVVCAPQNKANHSRRSSDISMDKEVEVLTRNTLLQIFRDKITALQSAAKKHLGNEHDADDIIHDALINILELDQQRFASINNPEAFLYTMVKNLSIDRHRKNSKAPERIYTEPDQFTASQNEPDRLLYAEQKKRLLKQALNELPLACRQAFVLHRYKNIPQKVIAAEMNLSLNSVERYIIKAHRHCQQRLQQGEQ